ncbi:hypothetical protein HSX37_08610|uniref:Uncharacterized protein n=1 Tax=Dendrosporobacter quercicolus TaxID=146817 RepID=A0A1G9Q1P8_9FIRM|nr:hypothetical protein [Dendrosporobacter quercicolus]NSL48087.1 hypothetical protein [Dendrosporobacter quercicolus DSM 1736]SDM04853.1 hypothetical protein SAMN04488502_10211 [Dendrosporobacter quercicolus]
MPKGSDGAELQLDQLEELTVLLRRISSDLRFAVDLTVRVRSQSQQNKPATISLWEELLSGLFGYIKQKSKESKDNLLSGISLTRMRFF